MINAFIALTDKDKRVLLILFLLIIVIIALVAVIGAIMIRVMRYQGKRMDDLTHDVVVSNVVEDKKSFRRYARIKNWQLFCIQAWKPILIILAAVLTLIIRNSVTNDWNYDLLDYKSTGFNTLFFIWDFNDPSIFHTFFGINLLADWPKIINYPHFSLEAWCSYIFFFGLLIGGGWYLVTLQCVIARTYRAMQLSNQIYSKSLEGYNKYSVNNNANANNLNNNQNNNPNNN